MQQLHFPSYSFTLKNRENKPYILDTIRKKYVRLTPEEWVRQHVIMFLIETHKYPKSLLNVEKEFLVNGTKKRYDIVVYNKDGSIFLMIECKSYDIAITQQVFDQIARYNLELNATYLMVTNGLDHYYCQMDYDNEHYTFLKELPKYTY
jgi:hypothetical protein